MYGRPIHIFLHRILTSLLYSMRLLCLLNEYVIIRYSKIKRVCNTRPCASPAGPSLSKYVHTFGF